MCAGSAPEGPHLPTVMITKYGFFRPGENVIGIKEGEVRTKPKNALLRKEFMLLRRI